MRLFTFVFQLNEQCLKAKDFQKLKNLACCDKTPGKKYNSCGNCKNATALDFNKVFRIVQYFLVFKFDWEILLCFDRSHACFFFDLAVLPDYVDERHHHRNSFHYQAKMRSA